MRIRFKEITLENFAVLGNLSMSFSTDESAPLTLIRGENNSGKTTLMRGILWTLFGEDLLPQWDGATHPVRPPWFGDGSEVVTRGEMTFTIDNASGNAVDFKLVRKARTKRGVIGIEYDNETEHLFRREAGAGFLPADEQIQALRAQHLPQEFGQFIIVDADKAEQFLGGTDANHDDSLMRSMTTKAVRSLLGIDPMLKVSGRIEQFGARKVADAAKLSSDRDIASLSKAHETSTIAVAEDEKKILYWQGELDSLSAHLLKLKTARDDELKRLGEGQRYIDEERKAELAKNLAIADRDAAVAAFGSQLVQEQGLIALFAPALMRVSQTLEPLKASGTIPATEISLLPRLLEKGECVCGLKFADHPEASLKLKLIIKNSGDAKARASFADSCLDYARESFNRSIGIGASDWGGELTTLRLEIAKKNKIIALALDKFEAAEEARKKYSNNGPKSLQDRIKNYDVIDDQYREAAEELRRAQEAKTMHESDLRSTAAKLQNAEGQSKQLKRAQALNAVAKTLAEVVVSARLNIESSQVESLDATIDFLFKDIIGAKVEGHYRHVGIRRVPGSERDFEPYITGPEGNDKPIGSVNGASRRAVAISLLLGISKVTGTSIPFVADSLLHATSGEVTLSLLKYLTDGSSVGQPILFVTRSDLSGTRVKDLATKQAGKTYTITSEAEVGGNVVHRDPNSSHSLESVICLCGPEECCQICERSEDQSDNLLVLRKEINR